MLPFLMLSAAARVLARSPPPPSSAPTAAAAPPAATPAAAPPAADPPVGVERRLATDLPWISARRLARPPAGGGGGAAGAAGALPGGGGGGGGGGAANQMNAESATSLYKLRIAGLEPNTHHLAVHGRAGVGVAEAGAVRLRDRIANSQSPGRLGKVLERGLTHLLRKQAVAVAEEAAEVLHQVGLQCKARVSYLSAEHECKHAADSPRPGGGGGGGGGTAPLVGGGGGGGGALDGGAGELGASGARDLGAGGAGGLRLMFCCPAPRDGGAGGATLRPGGGGGPARGGGGLAGGGPPEPLTKLRMNVSFFRI